MRVVSLVFIGSMLLVSFPPQAAFLHMVGSAYEVAFPQSPIRAVSACAAPLPPPTEAQAPVSTSALVFELSPPAKAKVAKKPVVSACVSACVSVCAFVVASGRMWS